MPKRTTTVSPTVKRWVSSLNLPTTYTVTYGAFNPYHQKAVGRVTITGGVTTRSVTVIKTKLGYLVTLVEREGGKVFELNTYNWPGWPPAPVGMVALTVTGWLG